MKNQICNYLTTLLPETTPEQFLDLLETPPESSMGDLPCLAFPLQRPYGKIQSSLPRNWQQDLQSRQTNWESKRWKQ